MEKVKKMNPFTKIVLLATAGAMIGLLAFAAGSGDETKQAATETAAAPANEYPIDFCVVSGEKLGSMGDPVVKTYDGREVQFCCNGCVARFEKDQKTYLKKLDDAVLTAQKANYPLETCVVSGEPLVTSAMGEPVDYMHNGRLVRFCCNNCVTAFKKDPEKFLAKLDAAPAKATEPVEDSHEGHSH